MKKTYKLCVDSGCNIVKDLPRETLENYFERVAWIS